MLALKILNLTIRAFAGAVSCVANTSIFAQTSVGAVDTPTALASNLTSISGFARRTLTNSVLLKFVEF